MLEFMRRRRAFFSKLGRSDPFSALCARYGERLAKWPSRPGPARRQEKVGVLVTPWLGTAVPFFSIECALMVAHEGAQVSLIWDDMDLVGNAPRDRQREAIASVVEMAGSALRVIRAEHLPAGDSDAAAAAQILENNAIWRMRGEDKAGEFLRRDPQATEKIASHIGAVERLLTKEKFDWILIPGGIFGLSGAYVAAAHATETSFTTYDSGIGVLRLAHDSIAAHLGDLPRTYAQVHPGWRDDVTACAKLIEVARGEIGDRAAARDFRQFQVAPAERRDDVRFDLLVPLNIRWDSAALARQRLFDSVAEWIAALLEWVTANPAASICIRQHPRERLDFARGSDTLTPLLERFAHLGPRLRFVGAAERLSTYDLLRGASVVLPHTSTVGIEAAMLGKPVVLSTRCYYEEFGFCRVARSRDEYFRLIGQACAGDLPVSPAQTEDAALAYHLTQRCALLRTPFTADPRDARTWMEQSPTALWETEELADFRRALLDHEPLSLVRHRRFQNAH